MEQRSARKWSIRGSDIVFAEKKRRQEERKETEMKKARGTSRSTISSRFGCIVKPVQAWNVVLLCTVDHSDEEMEEDADEEGSESYETWTAPDAVESTASVDPRHLIRLMGLFLRKPHS